MQIATDEAPGIEISKIEKSEESILMTQRTGDVEYELSTGSQDFLLLSCCPGGRLYLRVVYMLFHVVFASRNGYTGL